MVIYMETIIILVIILLPLLSQAIITSTYNTYAKIASSKNMTGKDGALNRTVVNAEPKVGRNDPCPCGSGKKYKNCCEKNA